MTQINTTRYFGNNSWTIDDVLEKAHESYNIEVTPEDAINLLENLTELKHTSDIEYGWQLIEEAIEKRFNVEQTW